MRRSITLIPAILFFFTLVACGRASEPPVTTATPSVPAATTARPAPSATPIPNGLPTPAAAHAPASGRTCATGKLPEATAESARVTMGPGPGIPASTAAGESLEIAAVIYTQDCRPLAGAQINLWQTDPAGIYGPGHGTDNLQCCFYLGSVTTDENGRIDIQTVKPGVYADEASPPPAHIHVEVLHPGLSGWETEIVFAGDPHLPAEVPPGMIAIQLEERSQKVAPAAVPARLFGEAEIITPLDGTEASQTTSPQATATPETGAAAGTPASFLSEEIEALNAQLIQAAQAGDTGAVQRLLSAGAQINARDAQGRTAVMAATHANQVETVRALIAAEADIDIQDNRQDNILLYAGAEGLPEMLALAIAAGADTRRTNRFGGTALIPAAERGHVEIVHMLLERSNVDVNHVNNLGWTALLEAVILGEGGEPHRQIVQLLVDHGANVSIPDKDGVTALEHARSRGYAEIEGILLAAPAQQAERDLLLIGAARIGDVEAVRRLLVQRADVGAQDAGGQTALIAAAWGNHLEVAEALIAAGADVNVQDKTQQSAYLIATSEGYLDLLRLTLANGADVRSLDSYNGTGLIRAAERGHFEIVRELLKTDIAIDHVNRLGWTALLEAIILGEGGQRHTETVSLLVEAGADVNLADGNGVTPLAHAQQRGFDEIAAILAAAGAK